MLRYAFIAKFKGGPKLPLWGDKDDMGKLGGFLRTMAAAPREVQFSKLGFCAPAGDHVIVSPQRGSVGGLKRIPGEQKSFRWELDPSDALQFAELVDVLAASSHGHQYLEPLRASRGEITVMVSSGEYPDGLIGLEAGRNG
jgi:hypothetical protein